jgi:alpha-glucosidase
MKLEREEKPSSLEEPNMTNDHWQVASPDELLSIQVELCDGKLTYSIFQLNDSDTHALLANSHLGIRRADQSFSDQLTFFSEGESVCINERYAMLIGKQRNLHNYCNEKQLTFKNQVGVQIQIILRAYTDGVAFRYVFPNVDPKEYKITDELTSFNLPCKGKFWSQPYDIVYEAGPAYETLYTRGKELEQIADLGKYPGWSFPFLIQTNTHWLMITEADLDKHYFGAHLKLDQQNSALAIAHPLAEEAQGIGDSYAVSSLPWRSPWRVFMIGRSPKTILESSLVYHLCAPNQINDTYWIKPGTVSWSWWSDHDSSRDFHKLKSYIDFSAEMGWSYSLVDANWNLFEEGSLEELAAYAETKGIGLFVWYNSGGPNNLVSEQPRDRMDERDIRRAEMAKLRDMGIKGIKVDFFISDKQIIIKKYLDILLDAADYQLMVNFHGCTLPRGWSRTYPHLMTMEAVRGAETLTFEDTYAAVAPWHNVVLAFTRNVVGPMDYTPLTFSDPHDFAPHLTTNAHELALSVIFESGLLHPADSHHSYRAQPDYVRNILRNVPTAWDETIFLDGYPAQYIVLARRFGEEWYIAGINGQKKGQALVLDLSFLSDADYDYDFIHDGDKGEVFQYHSGKITKSDRLRVYMANYGGFLFHTR